MMISQEKKDMSSARWTATWDTGGISPCTVYFFSQAKGLLLTPDLYLYLLK